MDSNIAPDDIKNRKLNRLSHYRNEFHNLPELPDAVEMSALPEQTFTGENNPGTVHILAHIEVKKKIKLPDAYLEKILNSKYTRHFYSETEINEVWSKWSINNQ